MAAKSCWLLEVIDADPAAENVIVGRVPVYVVYSLAPVVPGSAVWIDRNSDAGPVNVCPRRRASRRAFAFATDKAIGARLLAWMLSRSFGRWPLRILAR